MLSSSSSAKTLGGGGFCQRHTRARTIDAGGARRHSFFPSTATRMYSTLRYPACCAFLTHPPSSRRRVRRQAIWDKNQSQGLAGHAPRTWPSRLSITCLRNGARCLWRGCHAPREWEQVDAKLPLRVWLRGKSFHPRQCPPKLPLPCRHTPPPVRHDVMVKFAGATREPRRGEMRGDTPSVAITALRALFSSGPLRLILRE